MADVAVKKSPNDKRSYKRVVLKNGIEAMLMHDPEIPTQPATSPPADEDAVQERDPMEEDDEDSGSKTAAAAMSIAVGSSADPAILNGLAHYLEHMLFMGSEKYPDENEYDKYLEENGGFSNAFTDFEDTLYHFKVNGSKLHGALDRFAQFFVAPLCLEDSMDRELLAVDSEFALAKQSDAWRLRRLLCQSVKAGHVYQTFTSGNKKSLKEQPESNGVQVRETLLKFYKEHYSAERMRLAVLGGASLEEMESWVTSMFSNVSSGLGSAESNKNAGKPLEGQLYCVVPSIKKQHQICVTFQLPSLLSEYKKKSDHYISHLIGHEGPGSLLSELKRRSWAIELSAGVAESTFDASSCVYLFQVSMNLTEKGLHAKPGYGLAPVSLLFQYIDMMRQAGPLKWVYDEIKSVNEMKVKFLEEYDSLDYVARVAQEMQHIQPGDELLSSYMYDDWDPARIKELMSLMHPLADGVNVALQTSSFESIHSSLDKTSPTGQNLFTSIEEGWEPWYEFKFLKCGFHPETLNAFANNPCPKELHLPPENPYIPHDFTLHPSPDSTSKAPYVKPDLLTDEKGLRIWHKVDSLHRTPKTVASFALSVPMDEATQRPLCGVTPKASAASALLVSVLEDILAEECYMAEMADLRCNLSITAVGFQFTFSGYSEKIPVFIKSVFKSFAHLKMEEFVFQNMKDELIRKCENANMKVEKHSTYMSLYALTPTQWHVDDALKELRELTQQDLMEHHALMVKDIHIEALLYGNIVQEEALPLCREVRSIVGESSLHGDDRKILRCLKLPVGRHFLTLPSINQDENNNSIEAFFQFGKNELVERSTLDFVEQICDEPCFNILRTKEQLGYIVYSRARYTHGVLGFSVSIISERFAPNYLESRIEEFLTYIKNYLSEMSDEDFELNRTALIERKLEKEKNLRETSRNIWGHIATRIYDFDAKQKEVQVIKQLSKQDLLDWFSKHLIPEATDRCKLSVGIICPVHAAKPDSKTLPDSYVEITDVNLFRTQQEQFPEPSVALQ